MSWYFDTENWAAGVWDSWAEERTDTWREAMVAAQARDAGAAGPSYALTPEGTAGGADFSFVVIGDTGEGDASQHVLREYGVAVVMAGDTHDLEYYAERANGQSQTMHHFVNGGGGAYLSFGTALAWPAPAATAEWAFYPTTAQVKAKIDATTPWWKWPAWWWTTRFNAWPFSPEWLSAAFDVNAAPFFQSFMEIAVEPSAGRVRFIPHGVHGRLRWSDLQTSGALRPAGVAADAPVEWAVGMSAR